MQRLHETAATTDFKVAKPVSLDGLCKLFGGGLLRARGRHAEPGTSFAVRSSDPAFLLRRRILSFTTNPTTNERGNRWWLVSEAGRFVVEKGIGNWKGIFIERNH